MVARERFELSSAGPKPAMVFQAKQSMVFREVAPVGFNGEMGFDFQRFIENKSFYKVLEWAWREKGFSNSGTAWTEAHLTVRPFPLCRGPQL